MIALTIGVFDGVHLGHQLLLRHLKETALSTVVLTFSNHPSEILRKTTPALLTCLPLKIALLKEGGADEVLSIPFTRELADLPFEEFLAPYPIRHLILGEDAAFGRGCLGTPEALRLLGLKRNFSVHALPKLHIDNKPISSSRIRLLIEQGHLNEAEALLGRPHCLYVSPASDLSSLCLPPDGAYPVWSHSIRGIAPRILAIRNRTLELTNKNPQLISFGLNLNPLLFEKACQTSPAVL